MNVASAHLDSAATATVGVGEDESGLPVKGLVEELAGLHLDLGNKVLLVGVVVGVDVEPSAAKVEFTDLKTGHVVDLLIVLSVLVEQLS